MHRSRPLPAGCLRACRAEPWRCALTLNACRPVAASPTEHNTVGRLRGTPTTWSLHDATRGKRRMGLRSPALIALCRDAVICCRLRLPWSSRRRHYPKSPRSTQRKSSCSWSGCRSRQQQPNHHSHRTAVIGHVRACRPECVRACRKRDSMFCFTMFVPRQMDTLTTRVDAQLKSQVPPVGIGSAIQRAHSGGIVCVCATTCL
jgi:hypothetical protein